jgi:hypothetical protein
MVSLEFFSDNPAGRTMALGSTQPLTEMSTRCNSWRPPRVSVLSTHGMVRCARARVRACVRVFFFSLTCSSWSSRLGEWKECRLPSHKACCCGRPSPNRSPPMVAVTIKISQPSMYTSLCNLCHVDKLTKRYSALSETKQKKLKDHPHPLEVLGAFTRIILKRIVKKSCGNMRTGFISFHTVINVHNIIRETDQKSSGICSHVK